MSDPTLVILDRFEQVNAIPRCSTNEAELCQWLVSWAEHRNLAHECDQGGNLKVWLPASKGYESAPIVVLQAHMDMVCEKTPDSPHNFDKDPIVSHREGEWLTATDTTLGADNGIAIAYMLALAEHEGLEHPPIELLFTVDEETGLNGAKKLNPDFLKGRVLINLDSEDEGIFTVGCAGGIDTTITLPCEGERVPSNANCFHRVVVGGLKGGHSGIDIHKHRGNANRILARTLEQIQNAAPLKLISIQGGTLKNAIPRDAEALIWSEPVKGVDLVQTVTQIEQTLKKEYAISDNALFVKLENVSDIKSDEKALTQKATDHIIQILLALPNGVSHMSPEMEGMVETSSNLATVSLTDEKLTILSSQRSASVSRLNEITAAVTSVAKLAGATAKNHDAYPPWQPMMDSRLLRRSKVTYQELYNQKPVIQVIHAGLECAVIGDLYPAMDMISFGPTIRNPHSPDERILVPTIKKVWDLLVALLKRYSPHSHR
jgi:dipeptidase D